MNSTKNRLLVALFWSCMLGCLANPMVVLADTSSKPITRKRKKIVSLRTVGNTAALCCIALFLWRFRTQTSMPSPKPQQDTYIEDICSICFDPIRKIDLKTLTCTHFFHATCIAKWYARNPTCPLCRTPISNVHKR